MNDFEDCSNKELRSMHQFAYDRILKEQSVGEVPDELYTQLGWVCFEVLRRQSEDDDLPRLPDDPPTESGGELLYKTDPPLR